MKKIVIIGPESTGKSTLGAQLAAHFNTIWVEEYAREYLLKHGMNYKYEDLLEIAKGQIAGEDLAMVRGPLAEESPNEKQATHNEQLLFIDTDMYVMKVWCEFVFNECHHWILNRIAQRKYDLYLLCNIDLPWIQDELREYPDLVSRQKLYAYYKDILINQQVPWVEISGGYEERLEKAKKSLSVHLLHR